MNTPAQVLEAVHELSRLSRGGWVKRVAFANDVWASSVAQRLLLAAERPSSGGAASLFGGALAAEKGSGKKPLGPLVCHIGTLRMHVPSHCQDWVYSASRLRHECGKERVILLTWRPVDWRALEGPWQWWTRSFLDGSALLAAGEYVGDLDGVPGPFNGDQATGKAFRNPLQDMTL